MIDLEENKSFNMQLDLSSVVRYQQEYLEKAAEGQNQQQDHEKNHQSNNGLNYDAEVMCSERNNRGQVRGYLVKTAQNLSKFQRKKFYRRYYELDMHRNLLKIYERNGGPLKDTMVISVKNIVTNLQNDLRFGYQNFFTKPGYQGLTIEVPDQFKRPFAVFMHDDSMILLWAATESDFCLWTDAFRELKGDRPLNSTQTPQYLTNTDQAPIPEKTEQNYFVANLYLCLLPESIYYRSTSTIGAEESKGEQKQAQIADVGVEEVNGILKGWLFETTATKQRFVKRWYVLNAQTSTLLKGSGPDDNDPAVIDLRMQRLVHVDTNLLRSLPPNYKQNFASCQQLVKSEIVLPTENSEPIGLTFADGSLMLLWSQPGLSFDSWTLALKRFQIVNDTVMMNKEQQFSSKITWCVESPENLFILNLYRTLIPPKELNTSFVPTGSQKSLNFTEDEELKTVEGWLCKTPPDQPAKGDQGPFPKYYCILDLVKLNLLLCDKTNGQVAEKIELTDRLQSIDHYVVNEIKDESKAMEQVLQNLQIPNELKAPFALFFTNGEMALFWAESMEERQKWVKVFKRLIVEPLEEDNNWTIYQMRTKNNAFLTTLYTSLNRCSQNEPAEIILEQAISNDDADEENQQGVVKGNLTECVQVWDSESNQEIFKTNHYVLDLQSQVLSIFDKEDNTTEVEEKQLLGHKVQKVITCMTTELRADSMQLSGGLVSQEIQLPNREVAAFTLHFTDGGIKILWAPTFAEQEAWITAFRRIEIKESPTNNSQLWINLTENNFFAVALYRCLMPTVAPEEQNETGQEENVLQGFVRVAASNLVDRSKNNLFKKNFISLNQKTLVLRVLKDQEAEVPLEEIMLKENFRRIDTQLTNQLNIKEYQADLSQKFSEFENSVNFPILPADEFQYPLALIFEDGGIFLMWCQSEVQFLEWATVLSRLTTGQPFNNNFLVTSAENYFTALIYKHLKRISLNSQFTSNIQEEESKETIEEQKGNNIKPLVTENQIMGWLSRTQGHQVGQKDEPYIYRFFRLNISNGILSEYQEQNKTKKLTEFQLLRKITWVELNLSNTLAPNFEQIFAKQNCALPKNFCIPSEKLRPIGLHFVNGDFLLLWASVKREFDKWAQAFKQLQIPVLNPEENRQKIYLKVNQNNLFSTSILRSVLPREPINKVMPAEAIQTEQVMKGKCLKTSQMISYLQTDYIFKRFYILDTNARQLHISKSSGGKVKKPLDLNQLSWIDDSLTCRFIEGYRHILQEEGIDLSLTYDSFSTGDVKFTVQNYLYPIVLSFFDGEICLLWFESQEEKARLAAALKVIEAGVEDNTPGHKYLIRTIHNEFVIGIQRVLLKEDDQEDDPRLVKGVLQKAINRGSNMFKELYVHLDTRTGMLRFFPDPYSECSEEYELRWVNVITDLDHEQKQISLQNFERTEIVKWNLKSKVFAVHNAGQLFVFLAHDSQTFKMWTKAFKSLENENYIPSEGKILWVEKQSQPTQHIKLIEELSTKTQHEKSQAKWMKEVNGYMCKTSQQQNSVSNKIFYKRFYSINCTTKEILVRQKEGQPVKEKFSLNQLIYVDDRLNPFLASDYRLIFKGHYNSKIVLPKEYSYPIGLFFDNGEMQLLWASSEEQFLDWTRALKTFEPAAKLKYQFFQRHVANHFALTLYLCLVKERPALIHDSIKFEKKTVQELDNPSVSHRSQTPGDHQIGIENLPGFQDPDKIEYAGDGDLAAALFSSRGIIEGWLYKTSQELGFFQSELFYKRYYRLNLMTEELKIFNEPGGRIKSTIDLSKRIVKVDDKMQNFLRSSEAERRLGTKVFLPEFTYPFALFTETESMLLWAQNANDRTMWVDTFKSMMETTDENTVKNFKIRKDKKNKMVIGVYECLKEEQGGEEDDLAMAKRQQANKRSKTTGPVNRNKPKDEEEAAVASKPDLTNFGAALPMQNQNLELQATQEGLGPKLSNIKNEILVETSENDAQKTENLQRQLVEMGSTTPVLTKDKIQGFPAQAIQKQHGAQGQGSKENIQVHDRAAPSERPPRQQRGKSQGVFRKQKPQNKSFGTDRQVDGNDQNSGVTTRDESDNQMGNVALKKLKVIKKTPSQENIAVKAAAITENMSEMKIIEQDNMTSLDAPGSPQNSTTGEKRPGRRYRASQFGMRSSVTGGPLKIKKMIPSTYSSMAENHQQESLQSIFQGKAQPIMNHSMQNMQQHDSAADDDDDDMNDDIERDPAAEIIKPSFRRHANHSQRKIKVKLQRDSHNKTEADIDPAQAKRNTARSFYANRILTQNINFEDKVKNQSDNKFIESLIHSVNKRGQRSGSAWGNIAEDLRHKIKITANKKMQESFDMSPAKIVTKDNVQIVSTSHRLSEMMPTSGPIKVKAVEDQSDNAATQGNNQEEATMSQGDQGDEKQLSDWDEEEDAYSNMNSFKKQRSSRSIVNVRDRTSGLSNVYAGRNMTIDKPTHPKPGYSSNSLGTGSIHQNSAYFPQAPIKQKRNSFNGRMMRSVKQNSNPQQQQNLLGAQQKFKSSFDQQYQQEAEDKIEEDISPYKQQFEEEHQEVADAQANNVNDCIAESYNSVWD